MNLGTAQVIRANARHLPLADNSVDLVVTSPPYFALRSYQDGGEHYDGQIGAEPTPAEFVDSLLEVTAECVRVLKPSGSLFVNLGDKYVSRQSGYDQTNGGSWAKIHGETGDTRPNGVKVEHARGEHTRSHYLTEQTGIRPKSLIGIPWRYALACIDDLGLILRAEVIWSKPNGLPESVTDRVRRSHEQWFHFTLNPRYFSAVDEIREPHDSPLHKPGNKNGAAKAVGPMDRGGHSQWEEASQSRTWGNPLGKLPGSVWTVPTEPLRVPDHLGVDHFAAFPTEWPKRIIQGWSPAGVCVECGEGRRPVVHTEERLLHVQRRTRGYTDLARPNGDNGSHGPGEGKRVTANDVTITGYTCRCMDACAVCMGAMELHHVTPALQVAHERHTRPTRPAVVLDPFGGTGTTAMVAKALGRHGISVDMSQDYSRLAEWRTNDPAQLAKVLGVAKPDIQPPDQGSLFDIDGGAA